MWQKNLWNGARIVLARQVDAEVLTACALVGVAVFPVVGNAIALVLEMPRRAGQAMVLFGFASLATYGWFRLYDYRTLMRGAVGRRLIYAFSISTGLVAGLAVPAVITGSRPTLYPLYAALVTTIWLSLATLNLIGWGGNPKSREQFISTVGFNRFVCALLGAIVLVAYFKGPQEGVVYMAFGGSTTLAGMSAAMMAGLALTTLRGCYRSIGLLFAIYLVFVATSRTGVLLLITLFVVVLVTRSFEAKRGQDFWSRILHDVFIFLMIATVVVLPARFSMFYPYYSSRPETRTAYEGTAIRQLDALLLRYSRLLRLFRPIVFMNESNEEVLTKFKSADNRWEILIGTATVVRANSWGYWPRSFDEVLQIECGSPAIPALCTYPHNLPLEIGFYFGWLPLGLLAIGLFVWGIRVVKSLTYPALSVRVAAVAFLGHLAFAQVSGDLFDHSIAMGFGAIWVAMNAGMKQRLTGTAVAEF